MTEKLRRFPGYWMYETTGVLKPAVETYLCDRPMTDSQIGAMRAYCRQWIMAPVWDRNPHAGPEERAALTHLREAVDELTSREALAAWIDEANDAGLDPL